MAEKTLLQQLNSLPDTIFSLIDKYKGDIIYKKGFCQLLTASRNAVEILVNDTDQHTEYEVILKATDEDCFIPEKYETCCMGCHFVCSPAAG